MGFFSFGGERGIRTPGPVTVNSFQDCRNRPLCHSSITACAVTYQSVAPSRYPSVGVIHLVEGRLLNKFSLFNDIIYLILTQ